MARRKATEKAAGPQPLRLGFYASRLALASVILFHVHCRDFPILLDDRDVDPTQCIAI